jgi:hypothetical protein
MTPLRDLQRVCIYRGLYIVYLSTIKRPMKYDGRTSIFYNENTDIDQLGYHMYMAPEQAVIGIQNFYGLPDRNPDKMGYKDYNLDLSTLKAFHE